MVVCVYILLNIIYIYISWSTVVLGDPMAPFSITTTREDTSPSLDCSTYPSSEPYNSE